jgi:hypothetical protein
MKASVLALYYIAVAVGDTMAGVVYDALGATMSAAQLTWLFTGLMVCAAILFTVAAYKYQPVALVDDGEDAEPGRPRDDSGVGSLPELELGVAHLAPPALDKQQPQGAAV